MPNFILNITSQNDDLMLSNPDIQCYILSSDIEHTSLQKLVHQISNAEKISLLYGEKSVDIAPLLSADGVLIDLSKSENIKKDIKNIRHQLPQGILGTICRNRRHEAMIISENEPDFIVFKIGGDGTDKTLELAKWYNDFFLLQMAVFPQDAEADFTQYPCDIVILTPERYKIFVAKK